MELRQMFCQKWENVESILVNQKRTKIKKFKVTLKVIFNKIPKKFAWFSHNDETVLKV